MRRTLFGLGVEKVAIQSAFLQDPACFGEIASHAGEQAVVASIDVEKNWLGKHKVRASAGVRPRSSDWRHAAAGSSRQRRRRSAAYEHRT